MKHKSIKNIKLFVYDFDGVMTDNKVYLDQNGNETVKVNRGDGLAVSEIKKQGYLQLILSTEQNIVVEKRASKLNIPFIQGSKNKSLELKNYCQTNNIDLSDVAFIGNDLNDFEVMKIVGYSICPNDAQSEIKLLADLVISKNGGDGVIRELLSKINNEEN